MDWWRRQTMRYEIRPYTADGVERELVLGKGGSFHSVDALGKSIPGAQGGLQIPDVANLATLGLGIANLGVGLYNAYQTKRVQRDIGELRQTISCHFDMIDQVLRYQNTVLHEITLAQQRNEAKLDLILRELETGFGSVRASVKQVTQDRREDEFMLALSALLLAWRDASDQLAYSQDLPDSNLGKIEYRADNLLALTSERLQDPGIHLFARQPLVLGLLFAERSKIDALLFRSFERNHEIAGDKLGDLLKRVSQEADSLHTEAKPYDIFIRRGQVANYVMAKRALEQSRDHLRPGNDDAPIAIAPWDDGLPYLDDDSRTTARCDQPNEDEDDYGTSATIPVIYLNTLDDYEWYIRAFGQDKQEFNIHSVTSVPTELVAQMLGTTPDQLPPTEKQMKELLEPTLWDAYCQKIFDEFGIKIEWRRACLLPPETRAYDRIAHPGLICSSCGRGPEFASKEVEAPTGGRIVKRDLKEGGSS